MGSRLPIRGYRFRVWVFAGFMVLLVITSVSFTIGTAWYSKRTTSMIVQHDFRGRQIELSFVDLLLSMESNRKKFLLLKKPEYQERFYGAMEEIRKGLAELKTLGLSEKERVCWNELRDCLEGFLGMDPFAVQPEGSLPHGYGDIPMEKVHQLLRLNQERMNVRMAEMNRLEEKTIQIGLLWAVFSLLIAGMLSVFLIRSVTGPIRLLRKSTLEIAEGKFDHRISLNTRDELGQLADAFNDMAEQLKRLDDMKADFMAIVSHELKTPLTSMKEAVELLLEEAVGPLNAKQSHLLSINAQGIQKLAHFIDEILNLTRMEGGMLDIYRTWVDFQELLEERLMPFRLLAEKRHLGLSANYHPQPTPAIYADAERMKQVLDNLLDNAIRFTPSGGQVSVHVEFLEKGLPAPKAREEEGREISGAGLVVRVSDTGEGIAWAERKRVFDKFYQIRRKSSRGSGSGLGLSIAKHIVEAHGGSIWVEDSLPRGAAFVFTLPQEITQQAAVSTKVTSLEGRPSQPV